MKSAALITSALVTVFGIQAAQGEELTRDEAMKAAMAFKGTWEGTSPEGDKRTMTVRDVGSGSALIFERQDVTRILGWNPAKKCLEATSYYASGGQSYAEFKVVDDKPTFQMRAYDVDAEGNGHPFEATITFTGKDHYEMKSGELVWTTERKDK